MIYQNISLHNVESLIPCDGGLAMCRIPQQLLPAMRTEEAERIACLSSGVELRFRIRSGDARLYLHIAESGDDVIEGLPAQIMYGSFQGGWSVSAKFIGRKTTCITIPQSKNPQRLIDITNEQQLPYRSEMIRVLLPYSKCILDRIEGDLTPPLPDDEPALRLLCYGSSITHGSLAMGSKQCYASRLAHLLRADPINLGFAGGCQLEPEMAAYICQRSDWNIATLEMGVNMRTLPHDEFRSRVRSFVQIMQREQRPVFATGIFGHINVDQENTMQLRQILREEITGRLNYVDGLQLLNDPSMVAEDLVHPSTDGHETIAANWGALITKALRS